MDLDLEGTIMELHFDTDPECALIIKGILNLAPALQEIIGHWGQNFYEKLLLTKYDPGFMDTSS